MDIKDLANSQVKHYSTRLTDDCRPTTMPADLHEDFRGLWLLQHYGAADTHQAIKEVLDHESIHGGLGIGPEFLGFIEDYFRLAQYLQSRGTDYVIVDVGCCAALQQVFFTDFKGYLGIDEYLPSCTRPLSTSAHFLEGRFDDLVESGRFVIEDNMIGVANMSLLYGGGDASIAAFKKFKRLVMV